MSQKKERKKKTETDRLILREMTYDDYDALYNVLADSDIMCHYPYTFDEKRVRGWIEKNIRRYAVFGFGLWAVCLGETGEMIGDCGLTMQSIDGMILPEIGITSRKSTGDRASRSRLRRRCEGLGVREHAVSRGLLVHEKGQPAVKHDRSLDRDEQGRGI